MECYNSFQYADDKAVMSPPQKTRWDQYGFLPFRKVLARWIPPFFALLSVFCFPLNPADAQKHTSPDLHLQDTQFRFYRRAVQSLLKGEEGEANYSIARIRDWKAHSTNKSSYFVEWKVLESFYHSNLFSSYQWLNQRQKREESPGEHYILGLLSLELYRFQDAKHHFERTLALLQTDENNTPRNEFRFEPDQNDLLAINHRDARRAAYPSTIFLNVLPCSKNNEVPDGIRDDLFPPGNESFASLQNWMQNGATLTALHTRKSLPEDLLKKQSRVALYFLGEKAIEEEPMPESFPCKLIDNGPNNHFQFRYSLFRGIQKNDLRTFFQEARSLNRIGRHPFALHYLREALKKNHFPEGLATGRSDSEASLQIFHELSVTYNLLGFQNDRRSTELFSDFFAECMGKGDCTGEESALRFRNLALSQGNNREAMLFLISYYKSRGNQEKEMILRKRLEKRDQKRSETELHTAIKSLFQAALPEAGESE